MCRDNDLGKYLDQTYGLGRRSNPCLLSIVTVGELYALARLWSWGAKKQQALDDLLRLFTWVDISDPQILRHYGEIDAWATGQGHPLGKNDVWIAATAQATTATILTTDRDFDLLHSPDNSRSWRVDREWVDPNSKLPP